MAVCRVCGLCLTPRTQVLLGIAYRWWYCADHPGADQGDCGAGHVVEGD